MRVAFVASDLTFPPREGLHQQTTLLLKGLRGRGVTVELFGYCKRPEHLDRALLRAAVGVDFSLGPIVNPRPSVLVGLRNRLPWPSGRLEERLLQRIKSGGYDVVHLEGAAAAGLLRRAFADRAIVSFIDPGSRRRLRLARDTTAKMDALLQLVTGVLAYTLEATLRDARAVWHVVSESDREYLTRVHRKTRVTSISVQIPDPPDELARSRPRQPEAPSSTGAVVFADLAVPHMRRAVADFIVDVVRPIVRCLDEPLFTILGRVPPDSALSELCSGIPVRFLEWVDDYQVVLQNAAFVILPDTVGTGMKNRAVQSMASGKAVLGTPVAFEGLGVTSEHDAWIYNDVASARSGLTLLWRDRAMRASIGANAARLADRSFRSSFIVDQWMRLYLERMEGSAKLREARA